MMVLWAGAMLLAGAGAMAAPVATVAGGVGLAELVHIEAGWLPREDLAVELHAGTVVFNVLVGPAVTWTALGEPRGHQMLLTGALRVNPLVSPFTLKSGGESLAATGETYLGLRLCRRARLAASGPRRGVDVRRRRLRGRSQRGPDGRLRLRQLSAGP